VCKLVHVDVRVAHHHRDSLPSPEALKRAKVAIGDVMPGRPRVPAMLKDAGRRRFDVVMVWAIDRLGRSLIDLLGTIEHLEAVGVDLYLDQQSIDTTTPAAACCSR
jgi:DNA invertase Pin-like site-specific DNA recombinase